MGAENRLNTQEATIQQLQQELESVRAAAQEKEAALGEEAARREELQQSKAQIEEQVASVDVRCVG